MDKLLLVFSVCFALGWQACQPANQGKNPDDRLLAKVHNKSLYLSELEGMIPEAISEEDSALIINAFIERWARDAVMMYQAERSVPKDLNIDKLVRDYRASLITNNYEKILVEQLLDSVVSKKELVDFYERNKEQYQLEEAIVRGHFLKVPKSAPDTDKMEKWWASDKPEDFKLLVNYCNNYATVHLLEDSTWYQLKAIGSEWISGNLNLNGLAAGATVRRSDKDYLYLFRLLEWVPAKELAPISYAADQAKKVILHKRKMKLLDETKERMYDRALRRNDVKIYN